MHRITWLAFMGVLGCSAAQDSDLVDQPEAEAALAIEEAVVTTRVDYTTFRPTGSMGPSFPTSIRQLYLCLSVRTNDPVAVVVSWLRSGDDEPFSTSRLLLTGDRWLAAGYEAFGLFEPGSYRVRAETEERVLAEVDFTIEGDATTSSPPESQNEPILSRLRFVSSLGDDGRPAGPQTTLFPSGSREVHCAFSIDHAPSSTDVSVRWIRGSDLVRSSDLGQIEGTRDLQASLRSAQGELEAGLYRAEVVVNGTVMRSGAFTVQEALTSEGSGPRVTNVALTTAVDPESGRPTAPVLTHIRGSESAVYLSLTFSRMPPQGVLEIRWIRDSELEEGPIAVGRFQVGGRGSLAAELTPDSPLEIGLYHVDIVLGGAVLGTLRFEVDRPEPLPDNPDEE